MPIYKYLRVTTPGPAGTVLYFRNTDDNAAQELGEVDGWYYVFVPAEAEIPVQPPAIEWQRVDPDSGLRERIKSASRHCHLISDRMQQMIRAQYSLEDEQYFSRIGVGAALGVYQFRAGEQEALVAFGEFVEAARQWGREQRALIGL